MSVDLPDPDRPITTQISPGSTLKLASMTAAVSPLSRNSSLVCPCRSASTPRWGRRPKILYRPSAWIAGTRAPSSIVGRQVEQAPLGRLVDVASVAQRVGPSTHISKWTTERQSSDRPGSDTARPAVSGRDPWTRCSQAAHMLPWPGVTACFVRSSAGSSRAAIVGHNYWVTWGALVHLAQIRVAGPRWHPRTVPLGRGRVVQARVGIVEGVSGARVQLELHLLALTAGGDRRTDLLDLVEGDERVGGAEVVQARHGHRVRAVQQCWQRRAVVADQRGRRPVLLGGGGGGGEGEPAAVAEACQPHAGLVDGAVSAQGPESGDRISFGPFPGQGLRQLHPLRQPSLEVLVVIDRHHRWIQSREQLRSEEHTSELQSRGHLVCRLLLQTK